ncbi:TonB-dependent receptor [Marinoscillum pacificum]|uniref:TonB-dependent receptor n=1 Tax=Marinoscillum pacificum TaxID=392723 RepID=UPI002158088F|nr:TonB-dependent receptor [Marinoscillum pacificum]
MRYTLLLQFILFTLAATGQTILEGDVKDKTSEGLIGANVYIKDSYDGGTTDFDGHFRFETFETGDQILVVSFVGYETLELPINIEAAGNLQIELKESFNSIAAVTITAGAFEASDEKKAVVMKSLDIATTAGATADITGALNTLPGTQKVGESGRLFVRGGTSDETRIYIDGVEASNYYGATANGVPTRSRFSPFLFKGTFFSTGGYSAEFGQALSSALILNTNDVDPENKIDLSIMSVGLDAGVTRSWNDQSLYVKAGYMNLNPYNDLINQRVNWIDATKSWDGTLAYKKKLTNGGMFKVLGMTNTSGFHLEQYSTLSEKGYYDVQMANQNSFITSNVNLPVGDKDSFYFGGSASWNRDDLTYDETELSTPDFNMHWKAKFIHEFNAKQIINTGAEVFYTHVDREITTATDSVTLDYSNYNLAAYGEFDQYITEKLMMRFGARLSNQSVVSSTTLEPRFSMAYQVGEFAQFSLATGQFYQTPKKDYLLVTNTIDQERAQHYILNFQRIKESKIFRVETYLKDYDHLIRFQDQYDPTTFSNNGEGYAYGLDVFWRDRGGFKNIDYWVSYSWLKSERLFQDYPEKTTPGFSTAHNMSFVLKKFVPAIKSQLGATYSVTSGRPYENPNKEGFNESKTDVYQDLSFNMAFLPRPEVIIYLSATNLLGQDQVFGYRYANTPNDNGVIASEAIRLPAKRFLFIGCFITIGAFNKQLENL